MLLTRTSLLAGIGAFVLSGCTTLEPAPPSVVDLQILAINDFHGALVMPGYEYAYVDTDGPQSRALGGAAHLGATLDHLRRGQDHSITVAAGDLIGATPVVSSRFLDEPAIGALNRTGLELASVGNHEFDRGTDELLRKQNGGCEKYTQLEPCARESFAGAAFTYLAGNTVDAAGNTLFPGTAMRDFGALRVGFIGMTLKDTPSLVAPSAVQNYRFTDEAETANRLAHELRGEGADLLVLLLHQGGDVVPKFNTGGCPGLSGDILPILDALDPSISLVVSGHTHEAYACQIPAKDGSSRLLTSAGVNGSFVTDIRLTIDPASDRILSAEATNIPVTGERGEQADIAEYVAGYVAAAAPIAERPVGTYRIADDVAADATDCRDTPAERLVADAQAAAAADPKGGGAQFALTNSSGVRTPLPPAREGQLNFGQVFEMQPFGNFVLTVQLTGAQLKQVLEQQFCGEGVATTCYTLLIPSEDFRFSFDRARPPGERIVSMTLNDAPVDPAATYRIAINNYIADGGDGFSLLAQGTVIGDAGYDLDLMEAYLGRGAVIGVCGRVRDLTPDES